MSDKNIYQRVSAVMAAVEYVQKDASIDAPGAKYKAVTHDMVSAVLRKEFIKHGIVVRTNQAEGEYRQLRNVEAGIKQNLYHGIYLVHFVNIDNPDDYICCSLHASGTDSGDKAPNKAISTAVKYAMLKTFSLETGENEESRTYEAPEFTELQAAEFDELLNSGKPTEYVSFTQSVGPAVMTALINSFPKGKISQGKATARELEREGWAMIKDYAHQLTEHARADDETGIKELTDELTASEKRLVAGFMSKEDLAIIARINSHKTV